MEKVAYPLIPKRNPSHAECLILEGNRDWPRYAQYVLEGKKIYLSRSYLHDKNRPKFRARDLEEGRWFKGDGSDSKGAYFYRESIFPRS